MNNHITIVYCFDAKFSQYAAVSIFSLCFNTKTPLKIYCIVPNSDIRMNCPVLKVKNMLNANIDIIGFNHRSISEWKETSHITKGTYIRLLIPELIKSDRTIYLDSDTIVLSDLSELYHTEMNGNYIAGVCDPKGAKTSKVPRNHTDIYINAGVLLMDLDGLRKDQFFAKCEETYIKHYESLVWLDQCIINKYAENKKTIIDQKWNRQVFSNNYSRDDWNNMLSDGNTSILHFVGEVKPWMKWCNPEISKFWWNYANEISHEELKPIQMTNLNQALSYAKILDLNSDYESASLFKNQIIDTLLKIKK